MIRIVVVERGLSKYIDKILDGIERGEFECAIKIGNDNVCHFCSKAPICISSFIITDNFRIGKITIRKFLLLVPTCEDHKDEVDLIPFAWSIEKIREDFLVFVGKESKKYYEFLEDVWDNVKTYI